jgi:hypothetical protein|tara:strand:+ start:312 stop:569 length:258 start_codon:yes stop_codon:yes gene_type:complete
MPQGKGTYGSKVGRPPKAMKGMRVMKKGGRVPKLSISSKSVMVDPPKGFHWMEEQGRYYLMKGDYKPHPGAVRQAKFKQANHPKG